MSRTIIFLLSPRVIDFDTFLPTALALKAQRPDWTQRFVTFSPENDAFIRANPTLMAGLARCGTLHLLGAQGKVSRLRRYARRAGSLSRLARWIFARPAPLLFLSRPFSSWPYNLFYLLARARGGMGVLLAKSRSPDRQNHINWQRRAKPAKQPVTLLTRLLGRSADGLLYYHDDLRGNLEINDRYGRIDDLPWRRIGLPHLFPQWRALLVAEAARERERLRADGVPHDAELYAMFAAKAWSATNLRSLDAVERVFKQTLVTLCRLRPKAVVLIRPHPLAVDEPYVKEAMAEVGADRARLSFIHPEILMTLARRAVFNNPTNIMFSCFDGRMIDCSDYPDSHYAESGEVSLAHGLGPVFVNPVAADFESRFARALADDDLFEAPELSAERNRLIAAHPADLGPLLDLVER